MLFVSMNNCPRVLPQKYFINIRATRTWDSVYIGKTKRHLLVRQHKHLETTIFTDKELKYNEKDAGAIRKHCHQNQHNISLDNFKVLGNAINSFHLQLKESLLTLKMKPSLNIV